MKKCYNRLKSFLHIANVLSLIALETHKLLFLQIGFPEAFTEPCIASLKTITNMTRCPANLSSFEAAARRKNCSSLAGGARNCKSFQYHCVLGEDLMSAIELCAPSIYIIGRYTCILIKKCYKHFVLSFIIDDIQFSLLLFSNNVIYMTPMNSLNR